MTSETFPPFVRFPAWCGGGGAVMGCGRWHRQSNLYKWICSIRLGKSNWNFWFIKWWTKPLLKYHIYLEIRRKYSKTSSLNKNSCQLDSRPKSKAFKIHKHILAKMGTCTTRYINEQFRILLILHLKGVSWECEDGERPLQTELWRGPRPREHCLQGGGKLNDLQRSSDWATQRSYTWIWTGELMSNV